MKLILVSMLLTLTAFANSPGKNSIAVTEFRQEVDHWYDDCEHWYDWHYHNQLKTVLESALANHGMHVVERTNIRKMYADEFQMENLDPKTKSKAHKFIAAKYAVSGAVVEMGICEEKQGTGIQLGGIVSLLGGPDTDARVHVGGAVSRVKLAAKLIDVQTGEILKTFESETEARDTGLGLSASIVGIGANHKQKKHPPIERATNEGLDKIAAEISDYVRSK